MAKPVVRKPKKKANPLKAAKVEIHRLQGHCAAAQVHLRPRQDPRASGDRCVRPGAAADRHARSRTPARWRCCRTRARLAEREGTDHEDHSDPRGHRPRCRRRRRRRQGRLRPQLPAVPRTWPRRGPRAARSRSTRSARPARPARSRRSTRPRRSGARSRPPVSCRPRPARPAVCSAPSPPPTSPTRSRPPAAAARPAQDRGRPADQVHRRARGAGAAAPRGPGQGEPLRRRRLSIAPPGGREQRSATGLPEGARFHVEPGPFVVRRRRWATGRTSVQRPREGAGWAVTMCPEDPRR